MADFDIQVDGLKGVLSRIQRLPQVAQDEVLTDVGGYAIDRIQETEPPNKFVTRAEAYPGAVITLKNGRKVAGFFSPAQYYKVLALYAEGKVPYKRSGKLMENWSVVRSGNKVEIVNRTPGAGWVMGINQSAHEKLVGWKSIKTIIDKYLTFRNSKFRKAMYDAVEKAIRKLQLG